MCTELHIQCRSPSLPSCAVDLTPTSRMKMVGLAMVSRALKSTRPVNGAPGIWCCGTLPKSTTYLFESKLLPPDETRYPARRTKLRGGKWTGNNTIKTRKSKCIRLVNDQGRNKLHPTCVGSEKQDVPSEVIPVCRVRWQTLEAFLWWVPFWACVSIIIAQALWKLPGTDFHLLPFLNDWNVFLSFVMVWKLNTLRRLHCLLLSATHNWIFL